MLDLNGNPATSYDPDQNVWSGCSLQSLYNEDLTVGQVIFRQLQRQPQRIFQISHTDNTRLTRYQMLQNATKIGCYLRDKCFKKETDLVGLMARNSTHVAAVAYGCLFNGTPFHAVNPSLEHNTIASLYKITRPRILCCDVADYEKIKDIGASLGALIITVNGKLPGVMSVADLLQNPLPDDYEPAQFQRGVDRTMAILCSSGTTGTPKAVTLSNSRKLFEMHSYLGPDDVQYAPSTLDWLTGLITLVTAAVFGTVRLISSEMFSTTHFLDLCEQHEVSWTIMANSHVAMLANCPKTNAQKLRSLRHLLFAGGHCLVATLKKMQSFLRGSGILRNAYGLTEVGTLISYNYDTQSKPASVGRLLANIRVKVVDSSGQLQGPKGLGEILCHNGQPWSGYVGNPQATAEMRDSAGWYHTGDVGYFDEDNYLHIVERKKDMLKYLGMMYYPHEVEEVIAQMPDVAEVCVFGIFREMEGDAAAASVVLRSGSKLEPKHVEQYVRKNISVQFKHLHGGVQFVPQLAKSANGKVNRQAVKAAYLKDATQSKVQFTITTNN
ncbi:probable 4-coumarate--CoA ligase 2 [Drosophila santomea]|uniref:probable 4-coumarate--CoA ligase 2 n=1 Tax=Drosophila santomea TaxID=129105 RepID=UPI001954BD0F|nr:probable 4-coumarate--CoA ligase 2 [Drosophila santomea]